MKELYLEVNRIGVNINQITRKVNAGFATENDMAELRTLMEHIDRIMCEMASR